MQLPDQRKWVTLTVNGEERHFLRLFEESDEDFSSRVARILHEEMKSCESEPRRTNDQMSAALIKIRKRLAETPKRPLSESRVVKLQLSLIEAGSIKEPCKN